MESRINVVINILDLMKSYRLLSSVALLSLLLLIGCHFPQRDSFVLDIDNALSQNQQSQDLSSIATSIHYIKLKSAADLMIDDQSICGLYGFDNGFLIADKNGCYLFSDSGVFISQIGRSGRGPGEYSGITNMKYDKKTSTIYISHRAGKGVLKYDLEGNYIETIIPESFASFWTIYNGNILLNIANYRGDSPNMMTILKHQGDTIKTFQNNDQFVSEGGSVLSLNNRAIFYDFDNCVYYQRTFNDTLYVLKEDLQLIPSYIFQTSSYTIGSKTRADAVQYANSTEDFIFPWNIIETGKYLFVNMLRNGKGLWPFTLNKVTGEFYAVSKSDENRGYGNDLDGGLSFFPDYKINDKQVCSILSAYQIIDFDEKNNNKLQSILGEIISDDSNPVLMIVTLI